MKPYSRVQKTVAVILLASMAAALVPASAPAGTPADDLKQIEYRYYFRGKYPQAVEALRTFLARVDLPAAEKTRAREFLAASHVLGGTPAEGQLVFRELIEADPSYPGPDPAVFKPEVVLACDAARAEYAAARIREVQTPALPPASAAPVQTVPAAARRPVYRQWWFYAGAAAVAAIAVGVAASGDDGGETAGETGTLVIGVNVK